MSDTYKRIKPAKSIEIGKVVKTQSSKVNGILSLIGGFAIHMVSN